MKIISVGNLNTDEGSGYTANFLQSYARPQLEYASALREGRAPIITSVFASPAQLPPAGFTIESENPATQRSLRAALMRVLDTLDGPVAFTIADDDDANPRYMMLLVNKVDQVPGGKGLMFVANVTVAEDIYWQSVTETVVEENVTSSGGSFDVTNDGEREVYPAITITPRQAKSSQVWAYNRKVLVRWRYRPRFSTMGTAPLEITGGGLNTAALKTAGKVGTSRSIGVKVNGNFVAYWYGGADGTSRGFNSSNTTIWINRDRPERKLVVSTPYVTAEMTEISADSYDERDIPQIGRAYFPDTGEIIAWNGVGDDGALANVRRGVDGTTPAELESGMVGDIVDDIVIVYGPTADVLNPAHNPQASTISSAMTNFKSPIINANSTNGSWYFSDFANVKASHVTEWRSTADFNFHDGVAFVNETNAANDQGWGYEEPWKALGIEANVRTAPTYFYLKLPRPITAVSLTGRRQRGVLTYTNNRAPELRGIAQGTTRQNFFIWNASQNGTVYASTNALFNVNFNWTQPDVVELQWGVTTETYIQCDIQSMTLTFNSNYTPLVTVGAEQTDYDLNMYVYNATTGENLTVYLSDMLLDESLVIDCDKAQVTYTHDNSNQYTAVRRSNVRNYFMRLVPGVNTFQIFEGGLTDVDFEFTYRELFYN